MFDTDRIEGVRRQPGIRRGGGTAVGVVPGTPVVARGASVTTRLSDQVLVARGLALSSGQGPVFGPVDFELPPRRHAVILGEQGSGRSALLLALSGRMQGVTGELRLGRIDGIAHPRALRRLTAVARISDLVELEPNLTVAESIDEHALAEGLGVGRGRRVYRELADHVGLDLDPASSVGDLPAHLRTVFALVLASQRPSRFIVADDIDESLTREQLLDVHRVLGLLGERGHHVVMSALASSPVPPGAATLVLPTPEPNEGLALRFGHLRPRRILKES